MKTILSELGIMGESLKNALLDWLGWAPLLLKRFATSLRRNLSLGVLALALSTAMWVTITNGQNPFRVDTFAEPIPVGVTNVPANLELYGEVGSVMVRVSATPDVWGRLRKANFRAGIDLTRAGVGIQEMAVKVQVSEPQVRIVEVVPRKIPVRLEAIVRKMVPVRVEAGGSLPPGFSAGPADSSPQQVQAKGPEILVKQVESAVAKISLEERKASIKDSVTLVPQSSSGQIVEGVALEPPLATATVLIEQEIVYRKVSVAPTLRGNAASGYWVGSLRVDPPLVTIAGGRDVVEGIDIVKTVPVEIDGASASLDLSAEVEPAAGISLIDPRQVTIHVSVLPLQGTQTLLLAPAFQGLAPNLTAAAGPVYLTVSGPMSVLQRLTARQVGVILDVSNLISGTYSLIPQIQLPGGIEIMGVSPERVAVRLGGLEKAGED